MNSHRAIILVMTLGIEALLFTPCGSTVAQAAEAQAARDTAGRVLLVGVTLFDGTGQPVRRNQSVLIEGERIAAIFPAGSRPLPAGAEAHDLTGRYLIPGLIDTHVHVATGLSGESSRARTERRLRSAPGASAARSRSGTWPTWWCCETARGSILQIPARLSWS
jgi:imidazolonepropionase-like amidohydrolase